MLCLGDGRQTGWAGLVKSWQVMTLETQSGVRCGWAEFEIQKGLCRILLSEQCQAASGFDGMRAAWCAFDV